MQKALSNVVRAPSLKANHLKVLPFQRTPLVQFAHLLASNEPPSEDEELLVKNAIQAMRDEIENLQIELDNNNSHRRRLEQVEKRKATLLKDILIHESILSKLRKMPPEILQVIFQNIVPDTHSTFALPWSLGQVCRLWRTIVHSTPILWSSIILDFHRKKKFHRDQETMLKFVLHRSLGVNLRISIHGLNAMVGDKRLSLLSTLATHSERWESFVAELNVEAFLCLRTVRARLPRLSRLQLQLMSPQLQGLHVIYLDTFSIAPKLEWVALENVEATVPLPQLNSYKSITPPVFVDGQRVSIQSFAHLIEFVIQWEHVIDPSEPPVIFHRLQDLALFFNNDIVAIGFLEKIILPSINDMSIWCREQTTPILPHISSMISRSLPCHLRRFTIYTSIIENKGALTDLLLLIPELVSLEIPLYHLADLTNPSVDPEILVLIPALQFLTIRVDPFPSDLAQVLVTFIASRCERTAAMKPAYRTLRRLTLEFVTASECRLGYQQLQKLPPVGDLDAGVVAQLSSWKRRLVKEIPQLSCCPTPPSMLMNPIHWRKIDRLFSRIEEYTVQKSGYLQVSALHFAMYALNTTEPSGFIPGENYYQFRRRAKALLDRWEPLLHQDLPYYHWLNTSTHELTYVRKRSEFRRSTLATELIYNSANMHEFYK